MSMAKETEKLLRKALAVLPETDEEDILLTGITVKIVDRIARLKKSARVLERKYGSIDHLKTKIEREGVSPDDHRLYEDLLEWGAISQELNELTNVLESA